jgi:hypothetical protein
MTIFTPAKSFQARNIVNGATGTRAGYAVTPDGWLWISTVNFTFFFFFFFKFIIVISLLLFF